MFDGVEWSETAIVAAIIGAVAAVVGKSVDVLLRRVDRRHARLEQESQRAHETLLRAEADHVASRDRLLEQAAEARQWIYFTWADAHGPDIGWMPVAERPSKLPDEQAVVGALAEIAAEHATAEVRDIAANLRDSISGHYGDGPEQLPSEGDFRGWYDQATSLIDAMHTPLPAQRQPGVTRRRAQPVTYRAALPRDLPGALLLVSRYRPLLGWAALTLAWLGDAPIVVAKQGRRTAGVLALIGGAAEVRTRRRLVSAALGVGAVGFVWAWPIVTGLPVVWAVGVLVALALPHFNEIPVSRWDPKPPPRPGIHGIHDGILVVARGMRGRGIARILLEHAAAQLNEQPAWVATMNPRLARLYRMELLREADLYTRRTLWGVDEYGARRTWRGKKTVVVGRTR